MIPAEFTGGWVRQGISIGDKPPGEDAVVWWLQAPTLHADLRVLLVDSGVDTSAGLTSFAGTTTWDGSALTWTRLVDLEGFDGTDTGVASWDGADLLESGTFSSGNGLTRYTERWVRLPGSEGPLWACHRDEERLVRAGNYAITIADRRPSGGAFTATAWQLVGDQWQVHHTLPGVPLASTPPGSVDVSGEWIVDELVD